MHKHFLMGSTAGYRWMRATRAPEDDNGGGGGVDNSQGNSGAAPNSGASQDNASSGFNAAAFWNEPEGEGAADSGTGAQGSSSQQQQVAPADEAKEFGQRIAAITFDPVFNEKIIAELGEGNVDAVNQAIQGQLSKAMTQAITLSAELMQKQSRVMAQQVQAMIDNALGGRDDSQLLKDNFSSYEDPALRPMIQNVFQQSLKHSKGDKTKAIQMTKDMLAHMGGTGAKDFGITTPPGGADDYTSPGATSLVEELLGRRN